MTQAILDAKIALELELMRPLDYIGMSYIRAYEMNGGPPSAHDRIAFEKILEEALLKHYTRVVSVFQGKRPDIRTTLEGVSKSLGHLESLRARAKGNAHSFFHSIDRAFGQEMRNAPQGHVEDGTTNFAKSPEWKLETKAEADTEIKPKLPAGATVGYFANLKNAVGKVIGKFKSKIPTISNVNTNAVANQAMSLEVVAPKDANGSMIKVWNCKMDGRERLWHHDAHLEEAPIAGTFTVGGEQLRFPGDSSLGASLANLINCRCWPTYFFVHHDTGERTHIHTGVSAPTRRYQRKPNPQNGEVKPKLNPTTVVTLNGRTTARIVLRDLSYATLRQETPSTLTIRQNGKIIARATIKGPKVTNLTVDPKFRDQGLDKLIRDSAEHSATMDRRPYEQRVPQ